MPNFVNHCIEAIIDWIRSIRGILNRSEFIRFLIAGCVNTLFGFLAYSTAIFAGAAVWLALLSGTIAGIVFNFFSTGGYVFRMLSARLLPRFIACYFIIYVINFELITFLSEWERNVIILQFIIAFPIAILSYFMMSRFVFVGDKPFKKT
jgi:putative flippase GtrA